MARIEQGEKARKEVAKPSNPKLRLRTRLMETVNRIFTSKQEKLSDQKELLRGMSRRRMLALSAAAIVAACAPLPAAAQDTTPAKGKEVAAVEEKGEKTVEYETISDLSELQPYLDNAKDKIVRLKEGDSHRFGPYEFWTGLTTNGFTVISVDAKGATRDIGACIRGPPENINVLTLDMGDVHPYIKGKMLVFANNEEVRFIYFSKKANEYLNVAIVLEDGKMRPGLLQSGYGIKNDGGVFILTAPKELKPGAVITQANADANGEFGIAYFMYAPDKPSGTLISSIAMR